VRWAVDGDDGRARSLAGGHPGCRVTTDYHEALTDAAVVAVDLCLPHDLHAEVAVAAARAGKHVLVEKPLAATLDEADAMIEAAGRAGVVLMVAETVRFEAVYRRAKALLDDGAIGEPALIQISRQAYLRQSFLEERPWFLDAKRAAGGIMMSGGVHDFETMRLLVGEIESVQALRARQRFLEMEGDDTSVALVRFRSGAVGTLVESFLMKSLVTAAGPEVHSLRVDGALGSLALTRGEASVDTIRLFSERDEYRVGGAPAEQRILVPASDAFAEEIGHFLDCLGTGREPLTGGRDQRRPLEAVLAAYRSMESGAPVILGRSASGGGG
jgi:predicted dehydrogenase